MALSESSLREVSKASHPHNLVLIFAAAAALSLAPAPAFAQHGGGGGGGHAGGGGFGGGGGHFGGGGGGHFGGGGGSHASGGGGYHGGGGGYRVEGGGGSFGGGEVHSAHGSANSTGGGHWWSGLFGHRSNGNAEAGARGETSGPGAAAGGNSQAAIAAQRAFANSVARDNLAIHNTWQDPPPEFSAARAGSSFSGNAFAAGTTAPRGNSLVNARPFTPPAGVAGRQVGAPTSGFTTAPRTRLLAGQPRSAVAATNGPFGFYRRRYVGYPYYYSPYFYGGLGYGFYGGFGYGFGCDPFWIGWGGDCFGYGSPFWGGYGGYGYGGYGYGGYGYFGDSYPDDSSAPNYQVFSGGADSGPDDSGAAAANGANGNYTYQNSPQDTGLSADQSGADEEQPFVLYLKDGSSYAVSRYWVADNQLHYDTTYGGENSVALDRVDVQKTVDENAALGHSFTLAPAPGVQPNAAPPGSAPASPDAQPAPPASQGPPPSMDNDHTPPQSAPPQN